MHYFYMFGTCSVFENMLLNKHKTDHQSLQFNIYLNFKQNIKLYNLLQQLVQFNEIFLPVVDICSWTKV